MSPIKLLPVLALFATAPALAQEPDAHAAHNQPPAATETKPDDKGCPMHQMKMADSQGTQAGQHRKMMDKDQMHCMDAKAAHKPQQKAKPKPKTSK